MELGKQFSVVQRRTTRPPRFTGARQSGAVDTEYGIVHTPEDGPPRLVGYADYLGGRWNTPASYDEEFRKAPDGGSVPLFNQTEPEGVGAMAVDPEFQGRGLGKELANRVAEEHWSRYPTERGSVPPASVLSTASAGLIGKLTGRAPDSGHYSDHWDTDYGPEEMGITEDDFRDESGRVNRKQMESVASSMRGEFAEMMRSEFAEDTLRRGGHLAEDLSDHLSMGGSREPGTPISRSDPNQTASDTIRIAPEPPHTVEENVHRVITGRYPGEMPRRPRDRRRKAQKLRDAGHYTMFDE
jgi:GNAT superfamily N-acetyltransferase